MKPNQSLIPLSLLVLLGCGSADVSTAFPSEPDHADGTTTIQGLTTPAPAASGDRLKVKVLRGEDGSISTIPMGSTLFRDTARDEDCLVGRAADAKIRCLPLPGSYIDAPFYFSDAQCTQRLVGTHPSAEEVGIATDSTKKYVLEYVEVLVGTRKASGNRVRSLGPEYTGTVYYAGVACEPFQGGAGWKFFKAGTEVAPTSFVMFRGGLQQ